MEWSHWAVVEVTVRGTRVLNAVESFAILCLLDGRLVQPDRRFNSYLAQRSGTGVRPDSADRHRHHTILQSTCHNPTIQNSNPKPFITKHFHLSSLLVSLPAGRDCHQMSTPVDQSTPACPRMATAEMKSVRRTEHYLILSRMPLPGLTGLPSIITTRLTSPAPASARGNGPRFS